MSSSSSSSTAAQALARATALRSSLGPNPESQAKRKFQEHLITLASYAEYENKAFFGTFVAKYFGEFEDLQDKAIDALLDLCEDEDEKVRIIGIKGLGPTGKADPRWVRGNTGVLLQLLACQPRELKYVKESLHTLFSVSPSEVLQVMMDDCRNTEEETGTSRMNILEYLQYDLAEQRKLLLESGNNLDMEDIVREGLFDILEHANERESKIILGILEPMSTVSGKNVNNQTKKRYIKALIRSIPPRSSIDKTQPLLESFRTYTQKVPPADAKLGISLLAKHGEVVIKQGMGKNDTTARWFVESLKVWVSEVIDSWSIKGDDQDLEEDNLAPAFVKTHLPPFLDECVTLFRRGNLASAGDVIELLLFAIYRFTTDHDRRSQLIIRADSNTLTDLAKEAIKVERRTQKGSTEAEKWANIIDMAEILANPRSKIVKIVPSWGISTSRIPSGPSSSSNLTQRQNDLPQRTATPPNAPRGPRTSQTLPTGPRNSTAGPSSYPSKPVPSGPSNGTRYPIPSGPSSSHARPRPDSYDRRARARSPDRRAKSPDRGPRSPERKARSPERSPRSPARDRPSSTRISPPPPERRPPTAPSARREPPSAFAPAPKAIRPTITDDRPPTPPPDEPKRLISTKPPVIPSQPETTTNSLSIRNAAIRQPTSPAADTPTANTESSTKPAMSIRSSNPKIQPQIPSAPSTSIRSTQGEIKHSEENPKGTSLAERLGVSSPAPARVALPSNPNKRTRESDDTHTNGGGDRQMQIKKEERPSLLSRLGSKDGEMPQPKRMKEEPIKDIPQKPKLEVKEDAGGRLSLLDRINGKSSQSISSLSPSTTSIEIRSGTPLHQDSKPTSTSATHNQGLSILNKSATSSPQTQPSSLPPRPTQPRSMTILSRSVNSTSPSIPSAPKGFSILNRAASSSSLSPATQQEEDNGVVRKGRGFRTTTPEGQGRDIIMGDSTPSTVNAVAPLVGNSSANGSSNGNGGTGLAGRLSGNLNGGIRGRSMRGGFGSRFGPR
ncbi:hypothetical protein I302_107352 [Kwoniella bestiolae CBS 10118]|uniref:Uncharacterized protein n=1 Tax=Kwoniella bestiolae CBS 10118 TaxID=1296100 RepID=A0A1B9FYT3_9TREE|nr:hypothetical protein I302_06910 [Kwoniella bestiolae CBS 10118]OCF23924.1 hypothetical protein I302_06910 [Kwoniella bestiolae CBS 10118]